jgi:riboflavin synthase
MFTGIIQEVGTIRYTQKKGDGLIIRVEAPKSSELLKKGGSINLNGACQSAVNFVRDWFEVLATSETVSRTNFALFQTGDMVNLELPLTLNDPLGGHLVSGHVDDTGKVTSIKPGAESTIMEVAFKPENNKYLIEKGSIAVDGISLTAFSIKLETFSVSLIPETIERTNLKFRKIGDIVNLEFDLIGKYIEKFLNKDEETFSMDYLKKHGFMR